MPKSMIVGDVQGAAGEIRYGRREAFAHPTGQVEFFPVIIAQGKSEGPCLWLTGGIHGPEHAGPLVIHQVLQPDLVERMRGTIVAIPALNPVGLREMIRRPLPDEKDPNRLWPDGKPEKAPDPDLEPPTPTETAYKGLFADMLATADCHIDYHNAWTGSISFAFQDRVLYRKGADEAETAAAKAEAEALVMQQEAMLRAYGHTVICEMPVSKMFDEDLHRSTSAALLYIGRKPAITVELGTGHSPDPAIIHAAAAGTRNVMRWAGMLDGELEAITGIKVVDPGYPVTRRQTPRVRQAGVVFHRVQAGDMVSAGQPVAEFRDVWGRPIGDGYVYAEEEGFVIGRTHGIFLYPGEAIMGMAVRNTQPMIEPYPEDYFKS
jgi:hypothetical protein